MRGIDHILQMDTENDWFRVSNNELRRKTDYEKLLEKRVAELSKELNHEKNLPILSRILRRKHCKAQRGKNG